jgi:hypothetical protein
MILFAPASSETQHIKPPEAAAGENPDGTKEKEILYHAISYGSKRYPSQILAVIVFPPLSLVLLLFL